MGYYLTGRGDFYRSRGRGDPGFLSFLGGIAKSAVSFIPGIGPIASKALDVVGAASKAAPAATRAITVAKDVALAHPVLTAAGAAGIVGTAAGVAGGKMMSSRAGAGMGAAMNGMVHMRKHRRMNPYNPRALRRALRRTNSFAKMARQIIRVAAHYKHPRRFRIGHFKKKSKKR